jgi:threonine aldolase
MPEARIEALEAGGAHFYRWIEVAGEPLPVIRLVTSFVTTDREVESFLTLASRPSPF